MNFGERLIQVRELLGFSQVEFAKELSLVAQSLNRYEKNKVKPSIELLEKLTSTFHINSNWLLTGEGERLLELKSVSAQNVRNKIVKELENLSLEQLQFIETFLEFEKSKTS